MYCKMILLVVLLLIISINGQSNDDQDLPPLSYQAGRSSKASFDTQFSRGRCPERFYQIGDECLYFSTEGKIYSWQQAERMCSRQIARLLNQQSSSNINQPNMTPTRGVRQLILNTPEKTEILRALSREYNEQNFAVRLPFDYHILKRCLDGKDDKWPLYCKSGPISNSSCYEAVSHGPNDVCLRETDCNQGYLRLACEFTLPGSPELTHSKFRHCLKGRGSRRRLPMWAWIAIAIGGSILVLAILAGIFGLVCRKKKTSSKSRSLPEPRSTEEKVIKVSTKREDPAAQPMLIRAAPSRTTDTGYLEPRSSTRDNTSNA